MATSRKPKAKPEVSESPITSLDISGLGESVVKLHDKSTSETLCFIGVQEDEQKVYFAKAITPDQVSAVAEFLHKKKFSKYLSSNDYESAQEFANRKFTY